MNNSTIFNNSLTGVGGGAGFGNEGEATLTGNTITNNTGSSSGDVGGGILNFYLMTVTGGTISGNFAAGEGGGIDDDGTSLSVANCTIGQNTASSGAGVYSDSTTTIASSSITGNTSTGLGGGISTSDVSIVSVGMSTISGNSAAGEGGGIYNLGTLSVTNSTLSGNSAMGDGGGIAHVGGTIAIVNDTLSGNSSSASGGGIAALSTGASVLYSTLGGNSASSSGGGIFLSSQVLLVDTIVADTLNGGDLAGDTVSLASIHNLIDDAATDSGLTDGDGGNIIGHPASLGALGNYGGPTQTFNLLSESLALYAGAPLTLTTLGAAATNTSTTLTITASTTIAVGLYVRIDSEIVLITGMPTSTTLTVERGQLGTLAAAHTSEASLTLATDQRGDVRSILSPDIGSFELNAPTISSLSPNTGGTTVTLTGTQFVSGATVTVGGVSATNVVFVSATTITFTTPAGAVGQANVAITNPDSGSATDSGSFTYTGTAPVVGGITPSSGPIAGGTLVTITGTSFTGTTAVDFGDVPASSFTVVSATQIAAASPAEIAGSVDITATNAYGTSMLSPSDSFTFVAGPSLTGVSPATGPTSGGTTATILGTGFTGATAVDFGTTPASSFTVMSPTQIIATSPAEIAGGVAITVTNADGTSLLSPSDLFTYAAVPSITGVSPTTGPTSGGTSVTILGTGFTGATAVDFGEIPVSSFTVVSPTQIVVNSPAATLGAIDITVTTAGGISAATDADTFTYAAVPSVAGVSPSSGPLAGGTRVTITGTGFTGVAAVDFGTIPASSFTVVSPTQIIATSPATTAGAVGITVSTAGGISASTIADTFTYAAIPTVTGVIPSSAPLAGGTGVTLTGTGFTGTTTVDFGTKPASSFTVVSPTQIIATSPAATVGVDDITVTTVGGISVTSAADTFTYVAAPSVTNVRPSVGPTSGGTSVTILGTGFTGTTAVDFGTNPAINFTVVSDSQILATSAAGIAGSTGITVATVGGISASSRSDVFTYVVNPIITAVTPATGPIAGGTSVTIAGTGFTGASAVDFGTTPASSFTVVSDTEIMATSAAESAGSVDITVATMGGISLASAADTFTYTAPIVLQLQISGSVFFDYNANGTQDSGEPGLAGCTVYLDLTNSGQMEAGDPTSVTDANGGFSFTGLAAGTYTVRESLGYPNVATTGTAAASIVTLVGSNLVGVNLGNVLYNIAYPIDPQANLFAPSPAANANTAYVQGLYHTVLGRNPDTAGLANWVQDLNSGETHSSIAEGFVNSTEHRQNEVNSYYETLLNRPADSSGNGWVKLLESTGNESAVVAGIMSSAEYTADHSANSDFVNSMYKTLLGRQADSSGYAYWLKALDSGTTRLSVVNSFLHTTESAQLAVGSFYAAFLQRAGASGESGLWATQLQNGTISFGQVAVLFLSSTEFVADAAATVK